MLRYHQKTGLLEKYVVGSGWATLGTGYSGFGEGLNNPAQENIANQGPIPAGLWSLSFPFTHPTKGPIVFRLTTLTYRGPRGGFLIHGDNNTPEPNDASHGCIILEHDIRQKLVDDKQDYLWVEA